MTAGTFMKICREQAGISQVKLASAKTIQRLRNTPREEILKRQIKVIILGYQSGELSSDDLRQYSNIDPSKIGDLVRMIDM